MLIGKRRAARDRAGISAKKQVQCIFLRDDLSFEVGDCSGYVRERRLRTRNFKTRCCSSLEFLLKEVQRFLKTLDRAMGNVQLFVQGPQLEIALRHVREDYEPNVAPGFLAREIQSALRLIQFADPPKEVYFPKRAETVAVISMIRNKRRLSS